MAKKKEKSDTNARYGILGMSLKLELVFCMLSVIQFLVRPKSCYISLPFKCQSFTVIVGPQEVAGMIL